MTEGPSLETGQAFGRYVIEAQIGLGGMGAVYRARDTQLGRVVALKVVRPGRKDSSGVDPEVRLLSEARSVAALRHPNVVAVFDAGVIEGQTFVAMEFVEGKTLRAFVGDTRVSLAERRRWLGEVAEALAAAHRAGIVHRDVKPENVLIATDGRARVLDFGIAKRFEFDTAALTADGASPQTLEGRVVGTLSYMAPEQLSGSEVSPKWDQFSWGVMAYELLTGKHPRQTVPMPGPTAHLTQTPALPNEVEPRLTFHDVAAITLAMSPDTERRFPEMDDLVKAWSDRTSPAPVGPSVVPGTRPVTRGRGARVTPWLAAAGVLAAGLAMGFAMHRCGTKVAPSPSTATTTDVSTPPLVSAPASSSVAIVAAASSTASASASASKPVSSPLAAAPPSGTSGPCECHREVTVLCRAGANFNARVCECNADDGPVLYHEGPNPERWVGDTVTSGQPCHGRDSNGVERDGSIRTCFPMCETRVPGSHRMPCRGIEPFTGREVSGIFLCY